MTPLTCLHLHGEALGSTQQVALQLAQAQAKAEPAALQGLEAYSAWLAHWMGTTPNGLRVCPPLGMDAANGDAEKSLPADAPPAVLITATSQTAGRGTYGRQWASTPRTGWYGTWLLPGGLAPGAGLWDVSGWLQRVPYLAPLAVIEALEALARGDGGQGLSRLDWRLKPVNDVLIGHRKLSGALVNWTGPSAAQPDGVLVGVGLNLLYDAQRLQAVPHAISLQEAGWPAEDVALLCEPDGLFTHALGEAMWQRLLQSPPADAQALQQAWRPWQHPDYPLTL